MHRRDERHAADLLPDRAPQTLVRVAFGDAFAPATTGLSILSLVFVMTYVDTTLATAQAVVGKGWSVTLVSAGSVLVDAALVVVFVPIGRHLLGTGGECAGAAASVIATEVFVLVAMVSRFEAPPLDGRTSPPTRPAVRIRGVTRAYACSRSPPRRLVVTALASVTTVRALGVTMNSLHLRSMENRSASRTPGTR
jgi:hypothetical protein